MDAEGIVIIVMRLEQLSEQVILILTYFNYITPQGLKLRLLYVQAP